jgi:hypothetical protein
VQLLAAFIFDAIASDVTNTLANDVGSDDAPPSIQTDVLAPRSRSGDLGSD